MSSDAKPFFSICIPAYKRVKLLERLLDSIVTQTFKDFEVVVTDDSLDNTVELLCNNYRSGFTLKYFKNESSLGTPENWNRAIRNASGAWVKIMHDDDWFSNSDSLLLFSKAIKKKPSLDFFFCAYTNVFEATGKRNDIFAGRFQLRILNKNPVTLIANNIIGPPSVCVHRNNHRHLYDPKVKWVVDMDFYIRYLQNAPYCYIPELLVNVGINNTQVTTYTFGIPEYHLKENLYLLNKAGSRHLKNIIVYDAWWRLIRNFSILNIRQFYESGYTGVVPQTLVTIINFQKRLPANVLRTGILSKVLMLICYIKHARINGS